MSIQSHTPYPIDVDTLSAGYLSSCSYTDFVGAINQWNVPPGSFDTITRWRVFGGVDTTSSVFEVACTTGFSSRELARATGCAATGVDISQKSVELARYNARHHGGEVQVDYVVADVMAWPAEPRYTHVVLGAAAGFFDDEAALLGRCAQMLLDGGRILASPFFTTADIPVHLVERAREVFGIEVTTAGYDEVMAPYRGFDVLYESRAVPRQEPEESIESYCAATTARFSRETGIGDRTVLDLAHERLREIRRMSNDLRPFQAWSTLVLGKDDSRYPDRFVELF